MRLSKTKAPGSMSLGGFGVFRLLLRLFGSGEETLLTLRAVETVHSVRGLVARVVNMFGRGSTFAALRLLFEV